MRIGWAIVSGIVLGGGVAWWVDRDTPAETERKHTRAASARRADAGDARGRLYRWRDEAGVLQVSSSPPQGRDALRKVERIDMEPREGIEVRGGGSGD